LTENVFPLTSTLTLTLTLTPNPNPIKAQQYFWPDEITSVQTDHTTPIDVEDRMFLGMQDFDFAQI